MSARALAISGWMSEAEMTWLAEQAKDKDIIVEIGSYQGRSTRALGENAKGIVYAVDDWKGLRTIDKVWWEQITPEDERLSLYERFCSNIGDLIDRGKVVPIRANHASIPDLPVADMVFIDGSHDYDSVKRDVSYWIGRTRQGSLICGHDFYQEGISKAVRECTGIKEATADTIWSYIRP